MKRLWKASAIGLLGFATLAPMASARPVPDQRRPRVVIRGGGFARPVYPGWYYRAYDPFWDPFWGPRYGYGYAFPAPAPTTGDLKIKDPVKNATLYIDGGYVGLADKFKKVPLSPGTHRVEIRSPNGEPIYRQNVTVVLGKTTEIRPWAQSERG